MEHNSIVFLVQIVLMVLFFAISHLVVRSGYYGLISGFRRRPKKEQEALIERGYPQAMGMVILYAAIILAIGLVLMFFKVPYSFEGSLALMMVVLLGGMIYVQKHELPEKRKTAYIASSISAFLTVAIVAVALTLGFTDSKLTITDQTVEVSGLYGVEWDMESIDQVELIDELPEIIVRNNGYAFANRLKGHFRLEELGQGRLFINGPHTPYLLVFQGDSYFIINSDQEEVTKNWYDELTNKIN